MNSYLADANVVLALLAKSHIHHGLAWTWYRGLDEKDFGLCRLVQLTVLRLVATRRVRDGEFSPI